MLQRKKNKNELADIIVEISNHTKPDIIWQLITKIIVEISALSQNKTEDEEVWTRICSNVIYFSKYIKDTDQESLKKKGYQDIMQALFKHHKNDIDFKNKAFFKGGMWPEWFFMHGSPEMLAEEVESDNPLITYDFQSSKGLNSIMLALSGNNKEMIEHLVSTDEKILFAENKAAKNALMHAIDVLPCKDSIATLERLVNKCGKNVNQPNSQGKTLLTYILDNPTNNLKFIPMLLRAGANPKPFIDRKLTDRCDIYSKDENFSNYNSNHIEELLCLLDDSNGITLLNYLLDNPHKNLKLIPTLLNNGVTPEPLICLKINILCQLLKQSESLAQYVLSSEVVVNLLEKNKKGTLLKIALSDKSFATRLIQNSTAIKILSEKKNRLFALFFYESDYEHICNKFGSLKDQQTVKFTLS